MRAIGLTGYMGCGKGELVRLLLGRGYRATSLSDIVRNEATKLCKEHSRENLQAIGNALRASEGPGVLGKRIREAIASSNDDWVIDGIRHPKEFEELKKIPGFQMVAVIADTEVIVRRLQNRQRSGDALTRETILSNLAKEQGTHEPLSGQQVKKCVELADCIIINEGSLQELEEKLDHFLRLLDGSDRPTFGEIFMEIAYTWGQRATCLRRRVGAVLTRDKQQLTSGYNGAPSGVPHCAEVGCTRTKLNIPSGQRHEICRGTHAEQNAITQAAKLGISIDGATLYCNTFPCVICAKMILNAGITTVVYDSDYDDPLSKEILAQQTRVQLRRYEGRRIRPAEPSPQRNISVSAQTIPVRSIVR